MYMKLHINTSINKENKYIFSLVSDNFYKFMTMLEVNFQVKQTCLCCRTTRGSCNAGQTKQEQELL